MRLDRRRLLAEAALFSAFAACRRTSTNSADAATPDLGPAGPPHAFDPHHRATLDAVADRILPPEGDGPGATQARASEFIDRELSKPELAELRRAIQGGLLALDRRAASLGGRRFKDLSPDERDEVLTQLLHGSGQGREFAKLLVKLVLEGTFGDPSRGGNAGGVGFAFVGYSPPKRIP